MTWVKGLAYPQNKPPLDTPLTSVYKLCAF